MVWYKCCSAIFVWLWDIFHQEKQETEEKQALLDSTLETEAYPTPGENLQLHQGTELIANEDLEHAIIEYANENMINIGLRETALGVQKNAIRARMYQRTLQTVKTKLHGFTKPTPSFRSLEPGEFFDRSSVVEEETDDNKLLTKKYGQMLQDAYNETENFKKFPSCLITLSQEDKSV
ncbi:hypothetical protein Gasu2_25230 [Galdieria sulphuraria]|uniref:Uncharacterized protein n=1 Tax=Galdieria sulphuraria TaxID=130081 RepID=M2Y4S1_GALSU|nr:uncharacterized protein Gasu_18550 [Galdieria sulphuraria]EME30839.1 hypothetical protein Gasu_18550 [Galdieria sulphuraria]GJD08220.1 hypothetical protein Gasu2_25230 [Galdieria sulphuraria]|eukprot:XP_005707359.1 hypothetical protein Gasu_18550 [Galdieria sulphuraria]